MTPITDNERILLDALNEVDAIAIGITHGGGGSISNIATVITQRLADFHKAKEGECDATKAKSELPASGKPKDAQCDRCTVDEPYDPEIMAGGVYCAGCGRTRENTKYVLAGSSNVREEELWDEVGQIFYGGVSFHCYHHTLNELQSRFHITKKL